MKKLSTYLLLFSLIVFFISACGSKNDTQETAPLPPSTTGEQLRVDAGDQQVTLYWLKVAGADTYNVYYKASGIPTKTSYDQKITGLTSAPYIATGLTNGTIYYFAFTAVSTDGESDLSEVLPAIPQGAPDDPVPPEFPKNVRANAGNTTVTVTWSPVDDAEVYNLYQYSNLNDLNLVAEIKSTDVNCTDSQCSFTSTGLTNGTIYFFYLTAENNTSGKSDEVWVTPSASSPASGIQSTSLDPSSPQNVIVAPGDAMLILGWGAPSDGSFTSNSKYNVYYGLTPDFTPTANEKFPERTSPWDFSGLTNETTYYLYVTAVITSGPSFGVSATPTATPPPLAPIITNVEAGDGYVNLYWDPPATHTGSVTYNVYYATTMGLTKSTGTSPSSARGITDTAGQMASLTNEVKYYFVITAVDDNGESTESNEVWAIPSATSPSSGLEGTNLRNGSVVIYNL